MGDYTKLSTNEAQNIINYYDLGGLESLDALSLGISNSNYKVVVAGTPYLLKVSNDKNMEELAGEMDILLKLQEKKFTYSLVPIKTTENKPLYHLTSEQGDKFGVLFPFLDGIPPGPSDIACKEIGQGLGKLHSLNFSKDELNSKPRPIRNHEAVGFGAREVFDYANSAKCPKDFSGAFQQIFPHNLQWFMDNQWEEGIIHGDLYIDNTLFRNQELQVILDFEQGGTGEYILDLGISISGTCLEKGRLIRPLIRSFLEGYESERPLPKEEKIHLADAISLGLFSISLWRIKRFKEKNLNPLMSESYQDLLYKAQIFNESLKAEPIS